MASVCINYRSTIATSTRKDFELQTLFPSTDPSIDRSIFSILLLLVLVRAAQFGV
uniref:Uncharacterized protein n=1 Tax=Peronospora matthiolae TaxID=2874970 RepID=A0AAV1UCU6_9STRA